MRNPSLTILKAIAIILVVMAHSSCPTYASRFAYMICVSLFFMASGYCFDTKYLNDEATFVKRRFKRFYVPFVKWSVFFLIFNHFWFYIGFLSEHCGNAAGGVTHPLTLHQGMQALWSIVFNMSGYDQFLGGAFWFFRAMLVSSIAFLVGMKLIETIKWFKNQHTFSALVLCVVAVVLALWQMSDGLKWTGLAQGGYRELMGVFFLAAGFAYHRFELWLQVSVPNKSLFIVSAQANKHLLYATKVANAFYRGIITIIRWLSAQPLVSMMLCVIILTLLVIFPHPTMGPKARSMTDIFWLSLSGVVGFSFIYNISKMLHKVVFIRPVFDFIGTNTLYIFIWHLLAFKIVSMIKVAAFDLPWSMVGSHPVVHIGKGTWFWIVYTIVGIALPLGGIWLYRYCQARYDMRFYIDFLKKLTLYTWKGLYLITSKIAAIIVFCSKKLWIILSWLFFKIWEEIYGFCLTFVATIKASTDVNTDTDDQDEVDDDEEDDDEEDDEDEEIN